jgi:hypothetical protein
LLVRQRRYLLTTLLLPVALAAVSAAAALADLEIAQAHLAVILLLKPLLH